MQFTGIGNEGRGDETMDSESKTGGTADRVWFTYSAKCNLGNYESKDISAGMASDVLPDESVEDAFDRVQDQVVGQIDTLIPILRKNGTLGDYR